MKIAIFGTGYVGLITGACLANVGHEVKCIDIDQSRIKKLNQGIIPIYEPGLEDIVKKNIGRKFLTFSSSFEEGIKHGKICFIAVGTPSQEDGSVNVKYVYDLARKIGESMDEYKLIVNKSTVPVGTAQRVEEIILECLKAKKKEIDFDVCSNPEFLKEGSAIDDFIKPERIIIGTESNEVVELMNECYASFNRLKNKIIVMDPLSAEMTKYVANSMLATKISFMNEMSQVAERLGADIEKVRLGIGSDSRIGYQYIYPGCGYGGSCFPKDVRGLSMSAKQEGYEMKLLNAVEQVNQNQKNVLFDKLASQVGKDMKGKKIALWGLSFKPGTDDMREAPSLVVINSILSAGGQIIAHDPEAIDECKKYYVNNKNIQFSEDIYLPLEDSDALVICTEWKQYRQADIKELKNKMNSLIIIDGRNIFEPSYMKSEGIKYISIGRSNSI